MAAKEAAAAPKNPMKQVTVTFTVKGLDDKAVKEYFEGKKVSVTKNKGAWVAAYSARGAAKNDVAKRLDAMTRQTGSYKITEAVVVNLEAKPKKADTK